MTDLADIVIRNGRVLTMDAERPRADAIAIVGNRIAAVGTEAEIAGWVGASTRVIDAGGATVMPGFVESHIHLFVGAAEMEHLNLFGVKGEAALGEAVRAFADARPDLPLVVAQGCDYTVLSDAERPTRHHLDRFLPERPLVLVAPDHHTAWANTAALERAGLLKGRTLGPGNEVVMGADGLATGELREMEAFGPVMALGGAGRERLGLDTGGEPDPAPGEAEIAEDLAILRKGLAYAAGYGITSIHNMDGNRYLADLLERLDAAGELPCRVRVPYHYKNFRSLADLDVASDMAERHKGGKVTSGFVKVFYDGVLDSWTAVMLEPYADHPGVTGEPLFSPAAFAELATEIDRRGLQIAVHAIGDGAVRAVLDGYEAAARANGKRDSRHRIEHIEVIHADDIARFEELGVIASMQPPHPPGTMGMPLEPTVSRIGEARWPLSYAWRTLKEAGARIVFATDWPVSPLSPFHSLQAAMTREPWKDGLPDQRLSLLESIKAYTLGGAYAEHAEDDKGRLAVGLLADIVVLSSDIETTPADEIASLSAIVTIGNGQVTHDLVN